MYGMNSTIIYCKNFCKYHNVPPGQQNMIIKSSKKKYAFEENKTF
jgi:hypothetical protein